MSNAKNAFVERRHILDAALIANDFIYSIQKSKERGILCKLDIEKAYDLLNLDFLTSIMEKMGFGKRWIEWVEWCISLASFSVLVNGNPTMFFRSTRIKGKETRCPPNCLLLVWKPFLGSLIKQLRGYLDWF